MLLPSSASLSGAALAFLAMSSSPSSSSSKPRGVPPPPPPLLLSPYKMGPFELKNRVVMAPLTRMRATPGTHVPTQLNAEYYAQRASAAFIIGEATYVSRQGYGYMNSPGIETPAQVAGHRLITEAVHAQGGTIFLQLWHVGRISHPSLQHPEGTLPVAPSAIRPEGQVHFTPSGEPQPFATPRALTEEEIRTQLVPAFRRAAAHAKEAGYDGVEIHAANGYIIEQFLCDGSNARTDGYGGSIENRFRLLREIVEAVIGVLGPDRVGVRLSPSSTFNSITDTDRAGHTAYVVRELDAYGLAYLHVVEPRVEGSRDKEEEGEGGAIDWSLSTATWRKLWRGTLVGAGGYTRRGAERALTEGTVDLVAFGRYFIPNPDLPARFAAAFEAETEKGEGKGGEDGWTEVDREVLAPYDRSTFYGGTERGYTDFPTLVERQRRSKEMLN